MFLLKLLINLWNLLNEVAVPGLDAMHSSIKVAKSILKTSQTIIDKIDTIRHGIEDIPSQKGGKRDTCACIKFSKKDLPKLPVIPSEDNIISMIDKTRYKSVKKIKAMGGGSEKQNSSSNKKKQNTKNYVTAAEVPWPNFVPPPKAAYVEAEKPYAGVSEKWINIVEKMKKEAEKKKKQMDKEISKRKKQMANAKNMMNNAKKTAKELKEAPGKLKKNAKAAINNTKKSINNAKKDIKKSTNKKARKGGRRSKTNKKKISS